MWHYIAFHVFHSIVNGISKLLQLSSFSFNSFWQKFLHILNNINFNYKVHFVRGTVNVTFQCCKPLYPIYFWFPDSLHVNIFNSVPFVGGWQTPTYNNKIYHGYIALSYVLTMSHFTLLTNWELTVFNAIKI